MRKCTLHIAQNDGRVYGFLSVIKDADDSSINSIYRSVRLGISIFCLFMPTRCQEA